MAEKDAASRNVHDLKILPKYFEAVKSGLKPFEIRRIDREFAVGDMLILREWNPDSQSYTGNFCCREVTYILRDAEQFGLSPEYCILGIK